MTIATEKKPAPQKRSHHCGQTLETGQYRVQCCGAGHVHLHFTNPPKDGQYTLKPDEAYELAEDIMRGVDFCLGV